MKFSIAAAPLSKGQLRCFQCQKACLIKDGNWHTRGNQQIFLCKSCDKHKPLP